MFAISHVKMISLSHKECIDLINTYLCFGGRVCTGVADFHLFLLLERLLRDWTWSHNFRGPEKGMPTTSARQRPICLDQQIESYLRKQSGFLDNLPQFSWQILRDFLDGARTVNIYADDNTFEPNQCRTLYHRIVDDSLQNPDNRDQHGRRKSATTADRMVFKDFELFKSVGQECVFEKPLIQNSEQIVWCKADNLVSQAGCLSRGQQLKLWSSYITDMSPLCAAALFVKENPDFVNVIRAYLQCHLAGQIQFKALPSKAHHVCPTNEWPRHIAVERKFTYEFHLPYVVLRDREHTPPDRRAIRQWAPLIEPLDEASDRYASSLKTMGCYDAQVSLIVVGRHENNWKAYCNVDTYYGGQPEIEWFIKEELDAPAGDARSATDDVCTHPREYFLLVLSHRMRQISHEWSNVATALCQRLADYVRHYLLSRATY